MHGQQNAKKKKSVLCSKKVCLVSGVKRVNRDGLRDMRFPGVVGKYSRPVKVVTCVLASKCQRSGRACFRPTQGSSTSYGLPEEGDGKLLRNVRTLYQSTECHVHGDGRV